MTDSKEMEMTKSAAPDAGGEEEEFYEEPPRMGALDAVGVFVALLLLGVIGVAGYVWLTPGLNFSNLLPGGGSAAEDGMAAMAAASDGHDHTMAAAEHIKCAQCGMFADKSSSHIKADWSDESVTDHDSWGCVFDYAADHGLTLTAAWVVDFNTVQEPDSEPEWLAASSAWFVNGAESVAGSMPPYVAAFSTEEAARKAQQQLGGEVLDFAGLASALDFRSYEFTPGGEMAREAAEEQTGMEMDHSAAMEHAPATDIDMDEEMDKPAEDESAGEMDLAADAGRLDPLAAPETHSHDMSCPTCGMPADASGSQVVVIWSNGDHEHFDSWDCLFSRASGEGLDIVRAVVREYGDMDAAPHWLKAQSAWYLYDVNKIAMSMPPFVAAFESSAAAEAAQSELGGELVSFAGLQAHWE